MTARARQAGAGGPDAWRLDQPHRLRRADGEDDVVFRAAIAQRRDARRKRLLRMLDRERHEEFVRHAEVVREHIRPAGARQMAVAVNEAGHQRHIAEGNHVAVRATHRQIRLIADCRDRVTLILHEGVVMHAPAIGSPDTIRSHSHQRHTIPSPIISTAGRGRCGSIAVSVEKRVVSGRCQVSLSATKVGVRYCCLAPNRVVR